MGSWLETCGVTQLAIGYGDKARLILLKENKPATGTFVYMTDAWDPISLPILGKYDDYGRLNKIKFNPDAQRLLLEFLKGNIVETPKPKDPKAYVDKDEVVTKKGLTLNKALHWSERGVLKINDWSSGYRRQRIQEASGITDEQARAVWPGHIVQYMMVLEPIYQTMINMTVEGGGFAHGEDISRKDLLKSSEVFLEVIAKELKNKKFVLRQPSEWDGLEENTFAQHLRRDSGTPTAFSLCQTEILKLVETGKKKQAVGLIVGLVDAMIFNNVMSATRKMYTPNCGRGGQHDEYLLTKQIADATLMVCATREKERLENG